MPPLPRPTLAPDASRRRALRLAAGAVALVACRPALADAEALKAALAAYAGAREVAPGRVTIDIAEPCEPGVTVVGMCNSLIPHR